MGTYQVPRNVKGEGRILFIFSQKALMYTAIGAMIGFLIYLVLKAVKLSTLGIIILLILSVLGFAIGTFKVPDTNGLEITRKAGGENIDTVILNYIKFKNKKKKYYIYTKEDEKDA